jgi:hypothetical protein
MIDIEVVISGKDQFIPQECNETVFKKIGTEPVTIKYADHNYLEGRDELLMTVVKLLTT